MFTEAFHNIHEYHQPLLLLTGRFNQCKAHAEIPYIQLILISYILTIFSPHLTEIYYQHFPRTQLERHSIYTLLACELNDRWSITYAAAAARTSCRLALVKSDMTAEKTKVKTRRTATMTPMAELDVEMWLRYQRI